MSEAPPPPSPLVPAPEVRLVLTTVPPDSAHDLARALVEAGLAACVSLLPGVRSVYRWRGAVADDPETLLLVKTTAGRLDALTERLGRLHPYEVPEVLAFEPASAAGPYLAWLTGSVEGPPSP